MTLKIGCHGELQRRPRWSGELQSWFLLLWLYKYLLPNRSQKRVSLISKDELINALKSLGSDTSPEEVKRILNETDTNSDGFTSLDEFVVFCKGIAGESDGDGLDDLKEAFKLYDQDNNGVISASELHQIFEWNGVISEYD
ncbi:Calcium-binding EF-hand [Artemisia annua]|uniref:Calcium-binding EF-hand n=1 Tax=Artemisia annua TaxID=35608 RepID=A0A2U1Q1S4_ARTAN|nr:Calcium-binding EF-hand [Artemisia annua]